MPCIGCGAAPADMFIGWIPVDGNGDPESVALRVPPLEIWEMRIDQDIGEDGVLLGYAGATWPIVAFNYGTNFNVSGFVTSTENPQLVESHLDGVSAADFAAVKYKVIAPGAGEDDNTGKNGACHDPTPTNCEEDDPCTGSHRARIELTDGLFGDAYYTKSCTPAAPEDVAPTGSPPDYDSGEATPAATGSSPQKPVGFDDDGQGGDDKSKVVIEVPYGGCYCINSVSIKLQDDSGNDLKATSPITGQSYAVFILIDVVCHQCQWQEPIGLCCYEDEENQLCCAENVTKGTCILLADEEAYWGWDEGVGGDCEEDCPIDPDPGVPEAPAGEYGPCEEN